MTYNEWRDELKQNLLCVTPPERQRVLDYYAEAYADRREAGFSEREIIEDFGAPYDAAQRILSENKAEFRDFPDGEDKTRRDRRRENRERRRDGGAYAPLPRPTRITGQALILRLRLMRATAPTHTLRLPLCKIRPQRTTAAGTIPGRSFCFA